MIVLDWLKSEKQSNLSIIIVAIISATIPVIGSILIEKNDINNLRYEILQNINNNNNTQAQHNNVMVGTNTNIADIVSNTSNSNADLHDFLMDKWTTSKNLTPNKEGYFCPKKSPYPYWDFWTKEKYPANKEITIIFSLLDQTKDNKNPVFYLSYGEKTNITPDSFYRLNIFDGDLNTLRLYERDKQTSIFERSINQPNLNDYISLKITPIFPNSNSSKLILNPVISYKIENENYSFDPKTEYSVSLPISLPNEQGQGFRFGIGVSDGDCFKIISTNL